MDDELRELQHDLDKLMAELIAKVPSHVAFSDYVRLRERERALRRQIAMLEQARLPKSPSQ